MFENKNILITSCYIQELAHEYEMLYTTLSQLRKTLKKYEKRLHHKNFFYKVPPIYNIPTYTFSFLSVAKL